MNQVWLSSIAGEIRGTYIQNDWIAEFFYHNDRFPSLKDRIYSGKVIEIVKPLNRAIIDIGESRPAFIEVKNPKTLPTVGEKILVQILAHGDPTSLHDHALLKATTHISLNRGGLVLMPFRHEISMSQRALKDRSNVVMDALYESGFRGIVRSQALKQSEAKLLLTHQNLQDLWDTINRDYLESPTGTLLFSPPPLCRWLERLDEISQIYFDDPQLKPDLESFVLSLPQSSILVPSKLSYCGFPEEIEDAWQTLFQDDIPLTQSGGNIRIHHLSTAQLIDVNSGSTPSHIQPEQNFLKVNIEAAEEAVRHIRLRGLRGAILIDFITMKTPHNRKILEQKIKSLCKTDSYGLTFHGLTPMGLGEFTREGLFAPLPQLLSFNSERTKSSHVIATEILRACHSSSLKSRISITLHQKVYKMLQEHYAHAWELTTQRFAEIKIDESSERFDIFSVHSCEH
jgi:ribonuclease G